MASMTSTIPAYLLPGVPVYQPTHLEGDSNYATEILPGPPSLAAVQNPLAKRDPRKDSVTYSYLPASDPGTTYSGAMHGTWIGQDSRKSKRAKMDKGGSSGRAQRASARNQNGSSNAVDLVANPEAKSDSQPPPPSTDDLDITMIVDDEPSVSQPDSSQKFVDQSQSQGIGTRGEKKDKGKGKETEVSMRIKEEPQMVYLCSPEPQVDLLNNNDHCSACRSQGALVYCDGCPRAFHLWCLDPPMESIDDGDSTWFCPACTGPKNPPRKHPPGLLAPLIQSVDNSIPTEYQLPDDIRNFFKDVGTSARGNYVDISEIKPPRLNRHGQLEDRDAHRLRDRNGQPVLCFRCGTSALPESNAAAPPPTKRARKATVKGEQYEMWKNIISCDYCDLHWHLDCLDPPLSTMPSFSKKWMCPNHAEQIITPKHRIPKQNAAPIEITKPGQYNNGNVEIVEPQIIRPINVQPKINVDEVLINGRRYRVPERIILLDFWNKLSKTSGTQDAESRSSSPLTSLSSLEDEESMNPPPPPLDTFLQSDLEVAQMLWDFKRGSSLDGPVNRSISRKQSENSMIVDSVPSSSQPKPKPAKTSKPTAATKRAVPKAVEPIASTSSAPVVAVADSMVPPIETLSITPTSRRRRTNTITRTENGARALRPRSKAADRSRSEDEFETVSAPPAASSKPPRIRVKLEEPDTSSFLFSSGPAIIEPDATATVSAPPAKPPPKRRGRKKLVSAAAEPQPNSVSVKQENELLVPAPKRGKKRKDRDDEAPYIDRSERNHKAKEKRESKARAAKSVPSSTSVSSLSTLPSSVPTPGTVTSTPATPSLKIRLPRMTALGSPIKSVAAASSARSS